MNPHLKVVLTEMFKKVGTPFNEDLVKENDWYLKHTWSNKAENEFQTWFVNYLYTNIAARKALMATPQKNKAYIHLMVEEFIWKCGWKIKK